MLLHLRLKLVDSDRVVSASLLNSKESVDPHHFNIVVGLGRRHHPRLSSCIGSCYSQGLCQISVELHWLAASLALEWRRFLVTWSVHRSLGVFLISHFQTS